MKKQSGEIEKEVEVQLKEHEYCLRCGRRLKKLDCRLMGYGKICYIKQLTENSKNKLF